MARYYINRAIRGNTRLYASDQQIKPGEEIIAEQPFARIHPIRLEDIYDPNQVLNRVMEYNASRHLDHARDAMTQANRDTLDQLYNKDATGDIAALWATNAFQFEEKIGGQSYTGLLLFNHISRANHSCRPNAVFTWNAAREMGTLYALTTIHPMSEILIEYSANTEHCLRSGTKRCNDFDKHWGFKCECGACHRQERVKNRHNVKDDTLRNEAAKLLKEVENDVVPQNETAATTALRKLGLSDQYLEHLKELQIQDLKLADAHGMLAKYHEQAFDTFVPRLHAKECEWCDGGREKIRHLHEAHKALGREERIHTRCWGTEHADLSQDAAKRRAMNAKLDLNS